MSNSPSSPTYRNFVFNNVDIHLICPRYTTGIGTVLRLDSVLPIN